MGRCLACWHRSYHDQEYQIRHSISFILDKGLAVEIASCAGEYSWDHYSCTCPKELTKQNRPLTRLVHILLLHIIRGLIRSLARLRTPADEPNVLYCCDRFRSASWPQLNSLLAHKVNSTGSRAKYVDRTKKTGKRSLFMLALNRICCYCNIQYQ